MNIAIIGATGTIGKAIVSNMENRHTLFKAGKNQGDYQVDITSTDSLNRFFNDIGKVDAIISVAGDLHLGSIEDMSVDDFNVGLQSKLLGQVKVALTGQKYLHEGGSITLTSGIVSEQPIAGGSNPATVNAAIDAFVRGAAVDLPKVRINSVSPNVVIESLPNYGPFFPGFEAVPTKRVALAYQRSAEGPMTGYTFKVW